MEFKAVHALKKSNEMEALVYQRKKRVLALLFAGLIIIALFV
ncbi:hypothetical protein [Niastella yeongjuensis]|nr:hypothetical protein [Niastella yeongjuensis]